MLCGGSVESLDKFFHAVQTNTGIYTMNLKFDAFMDEQKNSHKRMVQILQKLAEK